MQALLDWVVENTDPFTSFILLIHLTYMRRIENSIKEDIRLMRKRINRLESLNLETAREKVTVGKDD